MYRLGTGVWNVSLAQPYPGWLECGALDTSFPTANAAVKVLDDLGIVTEMTGQKKNRSYSYPQYIELPTH